jgi:hypothetical protein
MRYIPEKDINIFPILTRWIQEEALFPGDPELSM